MKDALAKKFKREKEMLVLQKEKKEGERFDQEKHAEKIAALINRRETQDAKKQQNKNRELKQSQRKSEAVTQRRQELLFNRSQNRNSNTNTNRMLQGNDSNANLAATKAENSQLMMPMK